MKSAYTLKKHERIKRNSDFRRAKKDGAVVKESVFSLCVKENGLRSHRLGLIVSRKVMPLACDRNRIKRIVREIFRLNKPRIKRAPCDVIISIRKRTPEVLQYPTVNRRLLSLLERARLI